jgi:hypothetical protein
MPFAPGERTSQRSDAPCSTSTRKRLHRGVQSNVGDVPEDTVTVTGLVHSGTEAPGLVGSEEHAAIAQLRATIQLVRIRCLSF